MEHIIAFVAIWLWSAHPMKTKSLVVLFSAIAAVLIALLIWSARKPSQSSLPTTEPGQTVSPPKEASSIQPSHHERGSAPSTSPVPGQPATATGSVPPAAQSKDEQMRAGLATLNDQQVVLYGRACDQFGSPVGGATVSASIQVNNGTRVGTDRVSLETSASGAFTVSGYNGKTLGINITKAGYALATTNTRFIYSFLWPAAERHVPDPRNPVVFGMWKLQTREPLVEIGQRYNLDYKGAPINFDLLAGKVVPVGGDIRVTVNRPPGVVSERTLQDWSVQIEAVDGGLIRTSMAEARVTFQAPEAGYQTADTLIMSPNAPHKWFGGIDQVYFVQSRGGRVYSKVSFGIGINQQPDEKMEVEFRGQANTNASRNWEATAPR